MFPASREVRPRGSPRSPGAVPPTVPSHGHQEEGGLPETEREGLYE